MKPSIKYLRRILHGLHEGLVGCGPQVGGASVLPVRHPQQLLHNGREEGREAVGAGGVLLIYNIHHALLKMSPTHDIDI